MCVFIGNSTETNFIKVLKLGNGHSIRLEMARVRPQHTRIPIPTNSLCITHFQQEFNFSLHFECRNLYVDL